MTGLSQFVCMGHTDHCTKERFFSSFIVLYDTECWSTEQYASERHVIHSGAGSLRNVKQIGESVNHASAGHVELDGV